MNPPLNVSIIGAGIAGLTAAIALRRNGHLVQIFETSENKAEIGAALALQPNALCVLDHLGISRGNLKGLPLLRWTNFDAHSGEGLAANVPGGHNFLFIHRSDLHTELRRLATEDGDGPPAQIHLGSKVVACDIDAGTVTLSDGRSVHGDVVLGADGVNSITRTEILGSVVPAVPASWSCFRTVFEFQAQDLPELDWLISSGLYSVLSKNGPFRMFIVYPCRAPGLLVNFVGFYTDSPENDIEHTPTATLAEIRATFADFHPKFLRLLDLPEHSGIHRWHLRIVPPLATWTRGHTALLGDAAHATAPFLAQGAGMAIEDAGALGCLLPAGTSRADVPARLKAYETLRKERGEFVGTQSVAQPENLTVGGLAGLEARAQMEAELRKYDAILVAREYYAAHFVA
ncbi:FAD/NAD(P)-binding domain-containing protein [Mycena belliarum]|uniref:FAD/NAD(P)-binding domain-containing protein n=1 Tax=Mycena belliarum TaxID=1033014 RepID=A0AAD6UFU0_9AGAR|nr:FAD/NAD(P)-binding domain-containing protein [Mycena belliae]